MYMDIREKLALTCRILGTNGHDDIDRGHVSARENGQRDVIYMKPHSLALEEIQAEDIVTLDTNYNKLSGKFALHAELPIHVEIFKSRPDVNCVVHTHPLYATSLSSTGKRLRPINHDGVMFAKNLPVFDLTTDLVVTQELGQALAEKLGNANACLMKSHGIVTVGENIEQACIRAYTLEMAAKVQFTATLFGEPTWTDEDEADEKAKKIFSDANMNRMWLTMVRKLKRMESMYK
jgi:L-fuculose-phosphate aldolase